MAGENPLLQEAAKNARAGLFAALDNDLNTADALAPVFELVRAANAAMDDEQLFTADRDAILAVLQDFDAVFDVLEDRDAEPTRRALEWAKTSGRIGEVAAELIAAQSLTDDSRRGAGGRAHRGQEGAQFCPRRCDSGRARGKGRDFGRLERRRALEAEVKAAISF